MCCNGAPPRFQSFGLSSRRNRWAASSCPPLLWLTFHLASVHGLRPLAVVCDIWSYLHSFTGLAAVLKLRVRQLMTAERCPGRHIYATSNYSAERRLQELIPRFHAIERIAGQHDGGYQVRF